MSIQKHFNLKRFIKALQYDLTLNAKTYLFFVIGLFFGLLFIDLFAVANTGKEFPLDEYTTLFFFTFIISIVIVVGTSFPLLRDKKSSANYIMLPASVFEKFLIQFIIRVLCFFILFMVLFWIDFKVSKAIYYSIEWSRHTEIGTFSFFDSFRGREFKTTLDVIGFSAWLVTLSSFLFAGATCFKKHALFKTILSFALIIVFAFIISTIFTSIYYPRRLDLFSQPIYIMTYKINENLYNTQFLFYITGMLSSLFLFPLAYFKLKEKEL